jgi:hypothetical protein
MSPHADEPITALFDLSVHNIDDLRGAREAVDRLRPFDARISGDCAPRIKRRRVAGMPNHGGGN